MNFTVAQQLHDAGIIAQLPGDVALQAITAVTDSLLASPILAVQVVWYGDETADLIADLRQRSRAHMCVGVVASADVAVQKAVAAGAQFVVSPTRITVPSVLYVPRLELGEVCSHAVCQLQAKTVAEVSQMRQLLGRSTTLLVEMNAAIRPEDVALLHRHGADGVLVVKDLFEGEVQPMADFISRARVWHGAWSAALG